MRTRMFHFRFIAIFSIILYPLCSKLILAFAFHSSSTHLRVIPGECLCSNIICLRNPVHNTEECNAIEETGSRSGYSIQLADTREKVFYIKLYRFGGPTVEEHMKSNPDIRTREDALRSLTRFIDDKGVEKVFYGNGATAESIKFYALADDVSDYVSTEERGGGNVKVSHLLANGVIGSVEAVQETNIATDEFAQELSIELKNLSVYANARRRGIGKALTAAVQEYTRHQVSILNQEETDGCIGIVHLLVESENLGAVRLYEGAGFVLDDPEVKGPLSKLIWTIEGTQ